VHRSIDIVALFCNGLCVLQFVLWCAVCRGYFELVVTHCCAFVHASAQETGKIKQLTVGPLLAQCISNIHNHKSISALFK
jgi:phosphoribosylpyrophosphate synthetase